MKYIHSLTDRFINALDDLLLMYIQSTGHFKMNLSPKSQTSRLINRIDTVEKFRDIAELCEDFQAFVDEISEWGVDHIGGVDFDDPEVNHPMMNSFFASFGCTPENPHPCSKYAR